VIRDQDDLRAIFERKMQERQEFLDRYFVFSDLVQWQPPRDYARANGLVEDIRQAMLSQDEKAAPRARARAQGAEIARAGAAHPAAALGGPRRRERRWRRRLAAPPVTPAPGRTKIKVNPGGLGGATPSRTIDRTE
jgi:general secretion pathway protein D